MTLKTYAVIGTYSDGVTRRYHVSTENLDAHLTDRKRGLFPFAEMTAVPCSNVLTCNH
jgi:hypothetical protein